MREFLINYGFLFLWTISVIELILTSILFSDYRKKSDPVIICMAILGVGICFDAFTLAAGSKLMIPLLQVLSRGRFILHGLLIPVILAICAFGAPFYKRMRIVTLVVTSILMIAGGAAGCFRELDKVVLNEGMVSEIVRYASVSPKDSWMELVNKALSYGTIIPLILTGIWITIKHKTPSILLAGILMLVFSMLGPLTGNTDLIFLLSMFGELSMLLFFMIFEKRHINKMYDYYN